MAGYTRAQLDTIRRITGTASYKAASPRERKAALEAVLVESNATPVHGGDRDSSGAYQQRPSQGWGSASDSVETDTDQFLAAAHKANTEHGSAGELAADVQRPAASLRGKYQTRSVEADKLAGVHSLPSSTAVVKDQAPTVTKGGSTVDTRAAIGAALSDPRKGMSLASRILEQVQSGNFTTTVKPTVTAGKYSVSTSGDKSTVSTSGDTAKGRADAIDAKKLPYLWGGGHAAKVDAFHAAPLDCSGAVSAVLGINPRVAAQFETWGKPGASNKGVTVYAKSTHVIMSINGHFFGTSASNPGGGAGWIKRADISPAYLAGFTARHE